MAIAFAEGSQAIDTTEWSCPRDASYDIAQPQTAVGVYQVFLELNDMITGDELQIRIYEKVISSSTQRILLQSNPIGPQSPIWVSPAFTLGNGWDLTLKQIAGTAGITVNWSIRKVS